MKKFILFIFMAANAVYECKIPNVLYKWFREYELRFDDDEAVDRLKQELYLPESKVLGQVQKEVEQSNGLVTLISYNKYRLSDSAIEAFRSSSDWSVDENLNCHKNQFYLTILKHCINLESGTSSRQSPFSPSTFGSSRNCSPIVFKPVQGGAASPFSFSALSKLPELNEQVTALIDLEDVDD